MQDVLQVLGQRVAERPLGVRAADVERDLVQLVGGDLGAAQDETHLGAVAVADDDVPAVGDHRRHVLGGLVGRDVLVAHGLVHAVRDQRVPADRHDDESFGHEVDLSSS